jgi:hypothetical protein
MLSEFPMSLSEALGQYPYPSETILVEAIRIL